MKLIKGTQNWRSILGTETFFFGLGHPPTTTVQVRFAAKPWPGGRGSCAGQEPSLQKAGTQGHEGWRARSGMERPAASRASRRPCPTGLCCTRWAVMSHTLVWRGSGGQRQGASCQRYGSRRHQVPSFPAQQPFGCLGEGELFYKGGHPSKGAFSHRAGTAPIITVFIPGTPPANPPPTEACMITSNQHRGCRIQDRGARGYRWWITPDFSHSTRTAHGAPPEPLGASLHGAHTAPRGNLAFP